MRGDSNEFEAAFLAFYDTTKAEVYGYLLARTADEHAAEELLAEVYVAALRTLRRGDAELRIGWLMTVAKRRLVDHWRAAGRQRNKIERIGRQAAPAPEASGQGDEHVLDALRSLPERQRAAVAMRYLDEMSVSEISAALNLSYKATESLLSRGRASLRHAYSELAHDD